MWNGLWVTLHDVKTIQIVLDDAMLRAADKAAHEAKVNRSALFRNALAYYLRRHRYLELEERQRRGYEVKPVKRGEFDVWNTVAEWPEK